MGLEHLSLTGVETGIDRFFEVVRNASKPNGFEVNVTPGGGTQIGTRKLRRFSAEVALYRKENTADPQVGLRLIVRAFENLAGELVYVDHRINPDPSIVWVVEDATPIDAGDTTDIVSGRLSLVEIRQGIAVNALPLGTIIIPVVEATETGEGEAPALGDVAGDSTTSSNENCPREPSKLQEWGEEAQDLAQFVYVSVKNFWTNEGEAGEELADGVGEFIDDVAEVADGIGQAIGDAFDASTSIFRRGPCIEGEVT